MTTLVKSVGHLIGILECREAYGVDGPDGDGYQWLLGDAKEHGGIDTWPARLRELAGQVSIAHRMSIFQVMKLTLADFVDRLHVDAQEAAKVRLAAELHVAAVAKLLKPAPTTGGARTREKKTRKTATEYNIEARKYLRKFPHAGPRELIKALGCGAGTVYKLSAYQAVADARKKGRKPKAVSLTKEMADVTTKAEGELAKLVREQERDKRTNKVNSRERT